MVQKNYTQIISWHMNLQHALVKVLKKTGILPSINFNKKIRFRDKSIHVPLRHGLGYGNLFLKTSWLPTLSARFLQETVGSFIDVGVNIGQTLVAIRAIAPDIPYIGFEPNISCCYYAKELIRANGYQKTDVYNLALSDRLAHLSLQMDSESDSRASVIAELRPNYFSKKDRVLALAYDDLKIEEKVAVIKIDVEGAEYSVIKGMKRTIEANQPIIICEVLDIHNEEAANFTTEQAQNLSELLTSMNYIIIQLEQSKGRGEIVGFKVLKKFTLTFWTIESSKTNDYLFVPTARLAEIETILKDLV